MQCSITVDETKFIEGLKVAHQVAYSVRDRLKYIGTRQNETRGELCTYSRGGASIQLQQCPGHTDVQDLISNTVVDAVRYVDFIFFSKELKLPGLGVIIPTRGDLIVWEGKTYVVTAPTAADDVYNFTTMYRDRVRIHAVLTTALENG